MTQDVVSSKRKSRTSKKLGKTPTLPIFLVKQMYESFKTFQGTDGFSIHRTMKLVHTYLYFDVNQYDSFENKTYLIEADIGIVHEI